MTLLHPRTGLLAAGLFCFAACHGSSGTDIKGTAVVHYLQNGATQDVPVDLSQFRPTAVFPLPDGGWRTFTGGGDTAGNFRIGGAPEGSYYLTLDGFTWWVTSSRQSDWGTYVFGRSNLVAPGGSDALALNTTQMTPWAADDDIQLFSEAAGITEGSFRGAATLGIFATPDAGATQLQQSVPFAPLVQSLGNGGVLETTDNVILTHLVTQNVGSAFTHAASAREAVYATGLDMLNTGLATIQGPFEALDAGTTWTGTVRRGQFASLATGPGASADAGTLTLFLDVFPETLAHGFFGGAPDLVEAQLNVGSSDVSFSIPYQNPYPSSWPLLVAVELATRHSVPIPGTDAGFPVTSIVEYTDTPDGAAAHGLSPGVGTVSAANINGQAFTSAVFGATESPIISWSAPAVGSADEYIVTILRTDGLEQLSFFTTDTHLQPPPGLLLSGYGYVIVIRAHSTPAGLPPGPFYSAFPESSADLVSGVVQP